MAPDAERKLAEMVEVQTHLNNLVRDYQRLSGEMVHSSQFLQVMNGVFAGFVAIATLNAQLSEEE